MLADPVWQREGTGLPEAPGQEAPGLGQSWPLSRANSCSRKNPRLLRRGPWPESSNRAAFRGSLLFPTTPCRGGWPLGNAGGRGSGWHCPGPLSWLGRGLSASSTPSFLCAGVRRLHGSGATLSSLPCPQLGRGPAGEPVVLTGPGQGVGPEGRPVGFWSLPGEPSCCGPGCRWLPGEWVLSLARTEVLIRTHGQSSPRPGHVPRAPMQAGGKVMSYRAPGRPTCSLWCGGSSLQPGAGHRCPTPPRGQSARRAQEGNPTLMRRRLWDGSASRLPSRVVLGDGGLMASRRPPRFLPSHGNQGGRRRRRAPGCAQLMPRNATD